MTETELRQLIIAALEKIEAARTGRIRTEFVVRSPDGAADSEYVMSVHESLFDYGLQATTSRDEASDGLDYHSVVERRAFPAENIVYARSFAREDPIDELLAEMDPEYKKSDLANNRWSIMTPELFGLSHEELFPVPDYAWLKVALADPTKKITEQEEAGRVTLELALTEAEVTPEYRVDPVEGQPYRVSLTLRDGGLEQLRVDFPSNGKEYDPVRFRTLFWRMGKPVAIERPDPAECQSPIPPIATALASIAPFISVRYLTFELPDGRSFSARLVWYDRTGYYEIYPDAERIAYAPLAVGDKIRIWGSTRAPNRHRKVSFDLWAAFASDGQTIMDERPQVDDDEPPSWRAKFYERSVDVRDQWVTLREIHAVVEMAKVLFEEPAANESAEGKNFSLQDLKSAGLTVGSPVVVRLSALDGEHPIITRVELPDGTTAYNLIKANAEPLEEWD